MLSINWAYEMSLKLNPMDLWERDLRLVLHLLWMMPLVSAKDMAGITGGAENRFYRLAAELMERKLVVRVPMGRGQGKKLRHWLTSRGVLQVADETGEEVPWQVTETGIGWLIRGLPIVEEFYALAPGLMRHQGVKLDENVPLTTEPDGSGTTTQFTAGLRISDFRWMEKGEIDAVVCYENGAWFPLVWVGSMLPERQLIRKGELAVRQLDGRLKPAGWVVLGSDHLAAWLAAGFWPADNVLAVSADGHVEGEMRPGPFTEPLQGETKPERLGRPQNLTNWWNIRSRQYKPELAALDSPMNYAVLRFIAEWSGPTPERLERQFGTSYRAAVGPLRQAGLLEKLDGGFYVSKRGGRTLAHMDRVSPALIAGRLDSYLNEDGAYRKNQQNHNRSLIDAVQKLEHSDGIEAFGGWRTRRTAPDGTEVVPDATLLAVDEDGSSGIVFVELEFTASPPNLMQRKLGTYRALKRQTGEEIKQLWILENARVAERYRQALAGEPARTVALDELLKSSS